MANPKLKLLRILKILRETDETSPLTASEIGKNWPYTGSMNVSLFAVI